MVKNCLVSGHDTLQEKASSNSKITLYTTHFKVKVRIHLS